MSTIETVKLDGGACNGDFSLKEMQNQDWMIEDTKVTSKKNGYDFIYILKKNQPNLNISTMSQDKIIEKVLLQLEQKKAKEKKAKVKENKIRLTKMGKDLYLAQCSSCHGIKGEEKAYNTSLPLNSMKLGEMQRAIRSYTFDDQYGKGNAFVMKQYATNLTENKLKMVYEYLKSVNSKVSKK